METVVLLIPRYHIQSLSSTPLAKTRLFASSHLKLDLLTRVDYQEYGYLSILYGINVLHNWRVV